MGKELITNDITWVVLGTSIGTQSIGTDINNIGTGIDGCTRTQTPALVLVFTYNAEKIIVFIVCICIDLVNLNFLKIKIKKFDSVMIFASEWCSLSAPLEG